MDDWLPKVFKEHFLEISEIPKKHYLHINVDNFGHKYFIIENQVFPGNCREKISFPLSPRNFS